MRKSMPFQVNGLTTIAVINTANGLDLLQIADSCCAPAGCAGPSPAPAAGVDRPALTGVWQGDNRF